jgi:hypothetical protein
MKLKRAEMPALAPDGKRALEIFEEIIETLEDRVPTRGNADIGLSALPLPSLLSQCEAVIGNVEEIPVRAKAVFAMPGMAVLDLNWWQEHTVGIQASISRDSLSRKSAACVEIKRNGSIFALINVLGNPFPERLKELDVIVVVCHPYRAFLTLPDGQGRSLGDICAAFSDALDALPNARIVQFDIGKNQAHDLVAALDLPKVCGLPEPDNLIAGLVGVPPMFDGGKEYDLLCQRLGYDPNQLPEVAPEAALQSDFLLSRPLQRSESPAFVSAFLVRAAQVWRSIHPELKPLDTTEIVALLDRCVAAGDDGFLDHFSQATDQLRDDDAALACFAAAEHFRLLGQRMQALSFMGEGVSRTPLSAEWLRILAASLYLAMGNNREMINVLVSAALSPQLLGRDLQKRMAQAIAQQIGVPVNEHGHSLLIDAMSKTPPLPIDRKRVMIEIGTTREDVPGQGSTRKLALLCEQLNIHFVTVDMNQRNTRNAARAFALSRQPFDAVTAKGEDFLADHPGPIDFIFLDAYDFDHGNHSEIRQNAYERYLGARINDQACHQMHLDCARNLLDKLAPDGLICFDDTWRDMDGKWTAKGTTAMPFLLENGFEVIDERNRAALLRRSQRIGQSQHR